MIKLIKQLLDDFKSNYLYTIGLALVLALFTYDCYDGSKYFPDSTVQKNAGYSGPVPHSGYGVRFYHK
jgi:hypothetical protein